MKGGSSDMSMLSFFTNSLTVLSSLVFLSIFRGASGATFTFVNKCDYSIWPGILSSAGSPKLGSTGFELSKGSSRSFQAPTGWSGRFWGRSGCDFDGSGRGSCATGDCGSGEVECNGAGASPPATLAEFTLGSGSQDFYDVSLVDGYNLPMIIEGTGDSGACTTTGCVTDLNLQCPKELKAEDGGACKSACEAFGSPEYCCSGPYSSPATCKPSMYSQIFKTACPRSYSYAYDDATSTFTCSDADYTITFCPTSPSQKSATGSPPPKTTETTENPDLGSGSGSESGSRPGSVSDPAPVQENAFATSWLADLATGDSTRTQPPVAVQSAISLAVSLTLLTISHF